jgi:UDP-N-acetylglucosamine acyltransferase
MPQIHSTAIVGDDVELADDVEIGPHCILEGPITLGPGTRLLQRVSLHGPLTLGRGNVLYPNVCLGFAPQHRKFDPRQAGAGLVIGDENIFREGATAHRATGERPTRIGHRNYLMANCHIGHDAVVGDRVMMANGALLGGHVEVGHDAILGGNSAVHQFCRVGRLGMLSGADAISQDLPPFCIAYATKLIGSLNIVGLRRAGLGHHLRPLKRAFDLLFRSRLSRSSAVERILDELAGDPLCVEMAQFVRASQRGITAYGGTRGPAAEPDTMDGQGSESRVRRAAPISSV